MDGLYYVLYFAHAACIHQAVEDIARGVYKVGPIADKLAEIKASGDTLKARV